MKRTASLALIGFILTTAALSALISAVPFTAKAQPSDTCRATGELDPNSVPGAEIYVYRDAQGNPCTPNSEQTINPPGGTTKEAQEAENKCSAFDPSNWFQNCIWIPLMSWLGSWFLTIGGFFVRMAGTLFDALLRYVIVDFRGTLDMFGITTAINSGWTIFRDFSNILIIGIFVFIAISIILGLKEFGQKKLIANVLIVAVLINFSLLFTKMIIDASNFTALQIYNSTAAVSVGNGSKDIAQAFLTPMGIQSVWDTGHITAKVGTETKSAMQAFFFGLVGGILLLAVAGVLFYGCFLIASRAILFIFLMITAALAFATYLVPTLAKGEYGWSAWWKTLINNAIFAPLLMLFLAVSLVIVNSAGKYTIACPKDTPNCTSSLGKVIQSPELQLTDPSAWAAIFIYIIGIGLLFVSFRMASKFAGTISGFNIAAAIPAFGLAAGARVAAFAGRQAIGRPALAASEALKNRAQNARDGSMAQSLYKFGSQGLKGVGKTDFNTMRTPLGAGVASVTGMKLDTLAGKKIGGAEGARKARAEKYAAKAEDLKVDAKTQAGIIKKAVESEIASSPALLTRHQEATAGLSSHESSKDAAEKEYKAAQEMKVRAEMDIKRARQDNNTALEIEANKALRESDQNLREQENRIKTAATALKEAKEVVSNIENEARASAISKGNLKEYKSESDLAAHLAHSRYTNLLGRALGTSKLENDKLAQLSRKAVGDHHEKKEAKKIAEYLKDKTSGGHGEENKAAPTKEEHKEEQHTDQGKDAHAGGHDNHGH